MLALDRRRFIGQTLQLGCLSVLPSAAAMLEAESAPDAGLLSRMEWMNQPPVARIEGDRLIVQSTPKADFYRMPGWIIDTGNFFHLAAEGEFSFEARIAGQFVSKYDQAGLMLRQDAENWLKCGIEYIDGVRYGSVVLTRNLSDWSTMKDLSQSEPVWWRIVRRKNMVETLCSLDGKNFNSVHQAYGYFASATKLEVGLLCASTEGQGVRATFDSVKLTPIVT